MKEEDIQFNQKDKIKTPEAKIPPPPPPPPSSPKPKRPLKPPGEKLPPPLTPGSNVSDVLVLTAATFNRIYKEKNDVFIKFYAPWCGHCKKLAPVWIKLATAFKGKVTIAEMDCTTDTNKPFCGGKMGVKGYPTLKFYSHGDGEMKEKYLGARSFNVLKSYIEENMTKKEQEEEDD